MIKSISQIVGFNSKEKEPVRNILNEKCAFAYRIFNSFDRRYLEL